MKSSLGLKRGGITANVVLKSDDRMGVFALERIDGGLQLHISSRLLRTPRKRLPSYVRQGIACGHHVTTLNLGPVTAAALRFALDEFTRQETERYFRLRQQDEDKLRKMAGKKNKCE